MHSCAHVTATLWLSLTLLVFISVGLLALLEKLKERTVESFDFILVRLLKLGILQLTFRTYIKNFSAKNVFNKVIFIQVTTSLIIAVYTGNNLG